MLAEVPPYTYFNIALMPKYLLQFDKAMVNYMLAEVPPYTYFNIAFIPNK